MPPTPDQPLDLALIRQHSERAVAASAQQLAVAQAERRHSADVNGQQRAMLAEQRTNLAELRQTLREGPWVSADEDTYPSAPDPL